MSWDETDWSSAETWGLMIITIILDLLAILGWFYFAKKMFPSKQVNMGITITLMAVVITSIVGIFFQPLGWAAALSGVLVIIVPMIFKKLAAKR